jgi:hypothetical protein
MTEAEWLAATDLDSLDAVLEDGSERKLRLFAVACWQQIAELLLPEARLLIELAERHTDGQVSNARRIEAVTSLAMRPRSALDWRGRVFKQRCVLDSLAALNDTRVAEGITVESAPQKFSPALARRAKSCASSGRAVREQYLSFGPVERLREWAFHKLNKPTGVSYSGEFGNCSDDYQCGVLRDIFGNPFRPATVDPTWRTSTVLALAEGIYAERAFDRMPILADALQDAGCDNEDVLNHCRGDGPHVKGCWVVDLLLGKS